MQTVQYKRGGYQQGHGIRCKHCGHSFDEHQKPENVRHPKVLRKGFRASFSRCHRYGYEPGNQKEWARRERAQKKRERIDFEMACYERQAQGRAAWGQYAAHVQQTNYTRELRELENGAARGSGGREGKEAKDRLANFLENGRKRGTTFYIG